MADRRLQVFYTVARLLSFTKAAEALHMTQPAVTFQIRQLEEHFNTRLFDRTHSSIALTDVGKRVYLYAEKILEQYTQMENEVREITGNVGGLLLIGASTTIAEYMLPALLGDFKNKYPDVVIRLKVSNTEEIVSMVESNIIDLGVVEAPVSNKTLAVELCRMDELVAIIPINHPLAHNTTITPQEFARYPYISREEGSGTREVIATYFSRAGLSLYDLNIVMELGSSESIKGAVISGMGISIMSRAAIQKEIQLNILKQLQLVPCLERPFSFVHQKQKFQFLAMDELLKFASHYCITRSLQVA
ncbi:LysR family transcriptional regulator [Beggiatoa leptomitoformis]|uniref:LysR family transcriptional regulator n=1 Tax=Beggiatoa leptomitoformis TaxID=288004 RepID=A0A2N9YGX7_9GAMM|nr:LysR family transcriptional regulator [Beggiatoa leptomitoformis]ALG67962.1 LysR family transcriptional regulator [Beggiatoa leptomitoformis]AUI69760.1 LysR family transcriptional regulator [Beggiatoa leptomitoformis]